MRRLQQLGRIHWGVNAPRSYEKGPAAPTEVSRPCGGIPCHSTAEESELLGASVAFMKKEFLEEVQGLFGCNADPNYYAISEKLFLGPTGKGFHFDCPRDGLPGCSYVDAIDSNYTAQATVMLSWTWEYTVHTVVGTLSDWCNSKGLDPACVYVWQCALCCNQYRVQERRRQGQWEPFEVFHSIFERRVTSIGRVLALMTPWHEPKYVTRAWCAFEFWIAATTPGVCLEVVCASSEKDDMLAAMQDGWLTTMASQQQGTCALYHVDVRSAATSSPDDKANILRCIDPDAQSFDADTIQLAKLNLTVQKRLKDWCTGMMIVSLQPRIGQALDIKKHLMTAFSAGIMQFVNQSPDEYARAATIFEAACAIAAGSRAARTHEHASLEAISAYCRSLLGESIDAHEKAIRVMNWGALLPGGKAPQGWETFIPTMLDMILVSIFVAQGRFNAAMEVLDRLQPLVEEWSDTDSVGPRTSYRLFKQFKGCALFGLGRHVEAGCEMQHARVWMEKHGDTFGG